MGTVGGTTQERKLEARAAAVMRRKAVLLRYCARRLGSWAEAEEVLADLVWSALRHELPADSLGQRRWLFVRARGLCAARLRGRRRAAARFGVVRSLDETASPQSPSDGTLADTVADPRSPADVVLAGRELVREVLDGIAGLEPDDRELILAAADGAKPVDLAAERGIPAYTLRRRLRRARRRLLEALEPTAAEEVKRLLRPRAARRERP